MTTEELFQAGRLAEAIAAQTAEVKARPLDSDARFLLFVLLAFAGELERAEAQLEAAVLQEETLQQGAILYRSLLGSELERRKVFAEGLQPVFPPESPDTLGLRHTAVKQLAEGDTEGAAASLAEAEEQGVPLVGKINGAAYDGLRDYDDLLGQILEVFTAGRYLWIPFEQIRKVTVQPPKSHIDLLWAPAEVVDVQGNPVNVYVPTLYAGSHTHEDEALRLGRSTEWVDASGVAMRGVGQRVLFSMSGDEERETPILELRSLENEVGGD